MEYKEGHKAITFDMHIKVWDEVKATFKRNKQMRKDNKLPKKNLNTWVQEQMVKMLQEMRKENVDGLTKKE